MTVAKLAINERFRLPIQRPQIKLLDHFLRDHLPNQASGGFGMGQSVLNQIVVRSFITSWKPMPLLQSPTLANPIIQINFADYAKFADCSDDISFVSLFRQNSANAQISFEKSRTGGFDGKPNVCQNAFTAQS